MWLGQQTVGGQDDPRLDASIGRNGKPWFNGTTFDASWGNVTGYLVKKYDEDKVEGVAKSQSTVPQHRIRYAEVLLIKAEAMNESGTPGAAAVLDQVRDRAGLAPTSASTQVALRDAQGGYSGENAMVDEITEGKKIRIVFSENSAFEPVIANMILQFGQPVNILRADTRNVGGVAKGAMILQMPTDRDVRLKMEDYLRERGLEIEEVD